MSADELHCAIMIMLAGSMADDMATETFIARVATLPDRAKRLLVDRTDGSTQAARQAALVP